MLRTEVLIACWNISAYILFSTLKDQKDKNFLGCDRLSGRLFYFNDVSVVVHFGVKFDAQYPIFEITGVTEKVPYGLLFSKYDICEIFKNFGETFEFCNCQQEVKKT